jgi:hypothetical protein
VSSRGRLFVLALFLILIALSAAGRGALKAWAHCADEVLFHEAFKDAIGRWTSGEDWARAVRLAKPQDYSWLDRSTATIPIAHALGETSGEGNTLPALRRSVVAGFNFFEVDLWLDGDVVRCFHGPGPLPPLRPGDCTFESLLEALPADAWLVLDIKSDFVATGNRVVESLRRRGRAERMIFQLYQPQDLDTFSGWQAVLPLPGPIVTIYAARRSADHIAAEASRAGVRALTLPMSRLASFDRRPVALALFVHPVDDCAALAAARAQGVRGVYMENDLGCDAMPTTVRPRAAASLR